jgi:hypothetical protein
MARNLHSVSSDEPVAHGRFYNMLASVGLKVEGFIDKIIGDEVIADNPTLPFSNTLPGETEHGPSEAKAPETRK